MGFGGAMSQKVIDDIIKEVDENGDGEIQFEEFVHMMKKLTTS
jgi:Ca2+-binding EF-hand superfamily protein